jgi:hypothetical protein
MSIEFKSSDRRKNLKYKLFITLLLAFIIYGVITININLADVAKAKSAFAIEIKNDPIELVFDVGERQIIFSTRLFENFLDGTTVIYKVVKDQVISLVN